MSTRRQEYNKAHYEAIRVRREMLQRFKEEHPERYAELMEKVQADIEEAKDKPWMKLQTQTEPSEAEITQNSIRIHEFLIKFNEGRKDYFIDVEIPHDGWVETHKYFDSLYSDSFEEAKEVVLKYHPKMLPFKDTLKVTHTEKCRCPLCK